MPKPNRKPLTPEQKERKAQYMQRYRREYYLKNYERIREMHEEYRRHHLEKWRESSRRWQCQNPEKHREHSRNWSRKNPEKIRERDHRYRQANKDKENYRLAAQCAQARYRARKFHAEGTFTLSDIWRLLRQQRQRCALCKTPFPPEGTRYRFDIDHIESFSKGGSNDLGNLQLLCRPCNLRKAREDNK